MVRPSSYSQELADIICDRIARGESLRAVCETEGIPSKETVRNWLREDREGFLAQYTRAREEQADHYADEIIEIADKANDAQLARLQVDARKWKASKLAPKRYGEKVDLTHAGPDGGPIVVSWQE